MKKIILLILVLWLTGCAPRSFTTYSPVFSVDFNSLAFTPDGKTLAASSDRSIFLWDVATGRPAARWLAGDSDVTSIAFSPNGKTLASAFSDSPIILWDVQTHKPIGQPLNGDADVISVAFSPDGKTLASGSVRKGLLLWDLATRSLIGDWVSGDHNGLGAIWSTSQVTTEILSVAFSPDGKTLATGSVETGTVLWDVATGQPVGPPLAEDYVRSVAFSPDGKTLATGGCAKPVDFRECPRGKIILWDVATRQPVGLPLPADSLINGVAFSPDGKTLAAIWGQTINLWDVATGQPVGRPLAGHLDWLFSVAFNPDGKTLAAGGCGRSWTFESTICIQGKIILWDVGRR